MKKIFLFLIITLFATANAVSKENKNVKDCFEKITGACKELKSKTGCPNDDVDRFLEFAIGKWADSSSKF